MAALTSLMQLVTVPCPACGEEISTMVRADPAPNSGALAVRLEVEIDRVPIQDHINQHLLEESP